MSELPELPPDQLSVVVFGPGFGESIVVHAPPGEWLIVDSLEDPVASSPVDPANSTNPAIRFLHEHQAEPSALLLTHPHEDHAAGFDAFIERWTNAKIGYLSEHMSPSGDRLTAPDFEKSLRSGLAEHAVSAILDTWERFPNRKWDLLPGSTIDLGQAVVTVLGPSKRALRRAGAGKSVDANTLSVPLAIDWCGTRIVLGADLPATEWQQIVKDLPHANPGDHHALKVPHHGSKAAQDELLAHPSDGRERCWVLSPWKLAGGTLPRFEEDEGVDLMLRRVPEIHLTSLPLATSLRSGAKRASRAQIADATTRSRFGADDMVLLTHSTPVTSEDAWVAVSYSADGALDARSAGSASLTVYR
ncbi:MAG: MBL fold metallo-hydrolase [Solirubrobacteraceae bacterium]